MLHDLTQQLNGGTNMTNKINFNAKGFTIVTRNKATGELNEIFKLHQGRISKEEAQAYVDSLIEGDDNQGAEKVLGIEPYKRTFYLTPNQVDDFIQNQPVLKDVEA